MTKKDYIEQLAEEAEANNGVVHIPHTPPKATTPEETDKLLQAANNKVNDYMSIIDEINIYVSILNESNGALSPCIYAEIEAYNAAHPDNTTDFWRVLEGISHREPEAMEILEAARVKAQAGFNAQNELLEKHADLVPYIKTELKKARKDPTFNNITFWEILGSKEEGTAKDAPKSKAALILERAEESKRRKESAKKREKLPKLNNTIVLNDAMSHAITKAPKKEVSINDAIIRAYEVNQARQKQTPLNAVISLTYKGDDIKLSKPSNMLDAAVENGICSIVLRIEAENNNTFVPFSATYEDIWRAMIGTTNNKITPTPEQRQKIVDSINKSRFTEVVGDVSEEMKRHNYTFEDERIINGKFRRYRLNANIDTIETEKGRVIDAVTFNEEPIMLTYNKLKATDNNKNGHVLFLPLDLLNTDDNDGNAIEIKTYLLNRIIAMYYDSNYSRTIKYAHMYQSGIDAPEVRISRENNRTEKSKAEIKSDKTYRANIRKARAKDRERVKKILEKWKQKQFIKGYEEIKDGNTFVGVKVSLNPKAPQLNAKN